MFGSPQYIQPSPSPSNTSERKSFFPEPSLQQITGLSPTFGLKEENNKQERQYPDGIPRRVTQ